MLLINCYTCPQTKTKTIQAHEIVNNEIKRSYSKMPHDNKIVSVVMESI